MLKCLLAPAALLYKAGVTFRHRLFDWGVLKSEKFDIPVVCIGNITVGGTGKTPMAEMVIAYMSPSLIRLLRAKTARRLLPTAVQTRFLSKTEIPLSAATRLKAPLSAAA